MGCNVEKREKPVMSPARRLSDVVLCLAECLLGHTGQVLVHAWPGAKGGHWVKALDDSPPSPPSLGL